eukprot:scaffold42976_cov199-Amphora_coffeaeformis.AAC.1
MIAPKRTRFPSTCRPLHKETRDTRGVQMSRINTMYPVMTKSKKTASSPETHHSAGFPNAQRATSPYVAPPHHRAARHNMYRDRSVATAANKHSVTGSSPGRLLLVLVVLLVLLLPDEHLEKARGRLNTPPPTMVATRLNVA